MAKFKVGEEVRVSCVSASEFNQDKATITKVEDMDGGYYYQVTNQSYPSMWYSECSLHKLEVPITNEQIYKMFLKDNRMYSSFKRQLFNELPANREIVNVNEAVMDSTNWTKSREKSGRWIRLYHGWNALCKEFNLEGNINLTEV